MNKMARLRRYTRFLVGLFPYIIVFLIIAVCSYCNVCIELCASKYCGIPSLSQKMACAEECGCPFAYVYGINVLPIILTAIILVLVYPIIMISIRWCKERQFRNNLESFIRREINCEYRYNGYSISDHIRYSIVAPIVTEALTELVENFYRVQYQYTVSESMAIPVIAVRPSVRPTLHLSPYLYKVIDKPLPYIRRGKRHVNRRPFLFIPLRRYLNHKYVKPKIIVIHGM